jgi:NADPH-dependent ferric siderophore reductase
MAVTEMVDLALIVDEIVDLTPTLRAFWFTGAGDGFVYTPGQDVMISVPNGEAPIRRRYTIRRVDERGRIEMWVVLHGHGPGAVWATPCRSATASPASGHRQVVVVPDRAWHLFVADESGLAAARHGRAPGDTSAVVLVEVDGPDDEIRPVPVQWIHRDRDAWHNDLLEAR